MTMGDHKCFSKSNHTAGCILGGALRPLWKGKEEEGTQGLFLNMGRRQGIIIVSLPDSARDVFVQVCFGLKCKTDPFISHTTTSYDSLQIENRCCSKILLIHLKMIAH